MNVYSHIHMQVLVGEEALLKRLKEMERENQSLRMRLEQVYTNKSL